MKVAASKNPARPALAVLSGVLTLCLCLLLSGGAVAATKGYVIGVEDELDIRVWENPQLSVVVPVRPDGKITVPLVGDVVAAGLEPLKLKKNLEKGFSAYIRKPTVTVMVRSINSLKVYLVGSGITPQVISLKRNTSLLQLFSRMGPLKGADIEGAFLLRDKKRLDVDFYSLIVDGDASQDVELKPDDIIFVPDNFAKRIRIVGAVKEPQTIPYRRGLTIMDAVLSTGGFTDFADPDKITVIRKDGEGIEEIRVKLNAVIKKGDITRNIELMPGDFIIVKEGIF